MSEIDLKPTDQMAANAARGLELREKHGRGGTAVGVARARDISNRKNLSPDTVRRMNSYFARHAVDKQGEGWGEDSAGYIAWLLWGGDSGRAWAKRKSEELERKEDNSMSDMKKQINERLGMFARPGAKATFTLTDVLLDAMSALKNDESDAASYVDQATKSITRYRNEMTSDDRDWILYKKLIALANRKSVRISNPMTLRASRPGAKSTNAADILKVEVMDGSTVTSSMTPSDFMAYAKRSLPGIGSTSFLPDMIARFNELAEEKGMRVRVRSNLAKSNNAVREGDKISAAEDDAVSRKIRKLMAEGKPQDQAIAIALDMKRRGEI